MNFTILTKEIKKGIGVTEKITGHNLTLPILDNVLLEALPNFLKISATDLELGIQWWGLCKTEKEGKLAVPAKLLSQVVNIINQEKINIKERNNNLVIEGNNYKTQIKGFSPDDFPIIPTFGKDFYIEINPQKLKEGLTSVVNIVSLSQIRPEISGIYFYFDKDLVKLVATDSFRLAEKVLSFGNKAGYKNTFKNPISFILPQKAAKELINILTETEKDIKIYASESQVLFETYLTSLDHPEINLISRQIEGEYPSYQEIIPKNTKTKLILNKDEFTQKVKAAGIFGGRTNEIALKINPKEKEIEICSQDSEAGESNLFLGARIEGAELKVSYNWKFILEGLENIKSSEVSFEMQGNDGPSVIKPIGDESYIYVVMPIKV
ncbi:MAG TPA: DNA polymerase III subunit beta [Candidatus Pacearchaeota archaeon]|jgi:DNA polymerase-3 subunit beta|nr:DNA polymerase III subunit beta [Candidatus Pacearchaeota archaeon]HRR95031.1 DNA polymerase III subunit beta [Candidatus Paceibacterota bacterium]HPC30786.1 DNA polymerase III subunit beta [Candidatus Pacearchaeota archaeon]HQG09073.1 DNA polymerase III subunit beta [Candidatus Pacearchaeota archaeon]HQH20029.1 DNA polymerase III subunit beta [Candidatus Pacearchaeota archaeon]